MEFGTSVQEHMSEIYNFAESLESKQDKKLLPMTQLLDLMQGEICV
jgi:hypothetical protein